MKRFINGCSKSVVLAQAFENAGWDSWTCDLLPSEGWHKHIQGNILHHLADGWDFGIFHPDCRYLANSGVRWRIEREEQHEIEMAAWFFNHLLNLPFPHVIEIPIQHCYARRWVRKYDQIIQPWQFGDGESKAICLWLVGVPKLEPIITEKPTDVKQSTWRCPPSEHRAADRARNFEGVSKAMAKQWG